MTHRVANSRLFPVWFVRPPWGQSHLRSRAGTCRRPRSGCGLVLPASRSQASSHENSTVRYSRRLRRGRRGCSGSTSNRPSYTLKMYPAAQPQCMPAEPANRAGGRRVTGGVHVQVLVGGHPNPMRRPSMCRSSHPASPAARGCLPRQIECRTVSTFTQPSSTSWRANWLT